MQNYGESYASGLYILASLVLAASGNGLEKYYDEAAGILYFACDVIVLFLQFINRFQKARTVILFGGSIAGSFILLLGGFLDDIPSAETTLEWTGAIVRSISNFILIFASIAGVMTLFPKIKLPLLPEKPGIYYMISYSFFFAFSIIQLINKPSIMSLGYVLATILWMLAANAIRLKYDGSGTK